MVRFELTVRFPARRFSKPLPSTAQPHLQYGLIKVALFCNFGKNWYTAQVTFGPIVYRLGRKLFKL